MKFSDYKRLGKISIKSRKKSTKNTVRGISFGLILLVSVIFLTFAAFVSFNTEINKIRTIATFTVASKNFDNNSASDIGFAGENNWSYTYGLMSHNNMQKLKDNDNCLESLTSNIFRFGGDYSTPDVSVTLEGGELIPFRNKNQGSYVSHGVTTPNYGIKVCNLAESDGKILLDAELEDLGVSAFVAGGSFSKNDSKKEIIISQPAADIIDENGNYSSLIGKKVTFTVSGSLPYGVYLDNDVDPDNTFTRPTSWQNNTYTTDVLSEFEIVGVLSEKVFTLLTRVEQEPHLWISEQSMFYGENSEVASLLPVFTTVEDIDEWDNETTYTVATYKAAYSELKVTAKQNGLFFPFIAGMGMNRVDNSKTSTTLRAYTMLQGESFSAAVDLAAVISTELAAVNPGLESSEMNGLYQGTAYSMFNTLFTALQVVMLILYIFGGVLFVTSLLNLYNSINYSVQARRNYLGMMRAIGTRNSTIPKMYFVEMVLIFMRTLVWVLIFAFLICFGLRLLIAQLMKQIGDFLLGMNLSLNLIYFPVALVIVYGIMFLIAVFFALAACKGVSKKPILDVLRTDI